MVYTARVIIERDIRDYSDQDLSDLVDWITIISHVNVDPKKIKINYVSSITEGDKMFYTLDVRYYAEAGLQRRDISKKVIVELNKIGMFSIGLLRSFNITGKEEQDV